MKNIDASEVWTFLFIVRVINIGRTVAREQTLDRNTVLHIQWRC